MSEKLTMLDEYTRKIDRHGRSVVTWACPCGWKHIDDDEHGADVVQCGMCDARYALLPKQELARAVEAMPSDAPDVDELVQRHRAVALSRRRWIDAATAVLGDDWNGTPDDLRAALAKLLSIGRAQGLREAAGIVERFAAEWGGAHGVADEIAAAAEKAERGE